MGIKLIKKESMERCDSCGAVMTEYDYDRYGGLCKYCRSKESKTEVRARSPYHRARRDSEVSFKEYVSNYAKSQGFKKVSVEFQDGFVAISGGMAFPKWRVTIGEDSRDFEDQVQYKRDFCDIAFIDCDANRAIVKDWIDELSARKHSNEAPKSETAPDEYARNNFLEGALDYAEIEDDKGNVVLLKIAKRFEGEPGGDFCLRSYDGESDKGLAMGGIRYVVGRYGELLDMDPAEAIIKIAKE